MAMKKTLMWCFIGLLSLGSTARSHAQTTGGTEKAVAALEQQWLQSQKTNNPDLVAPLLADKFVKTGRCKATGTDASGKPLDVHERWTDTWVKMSNGKWQCVASHGSPVKM